MEGLPAWLSRLKIHLQCTRHRRGWFDPWVGKISCRRECQPTPVFLPGEILPIPWQATVQGVTKSWTQLSFLPKNAMLHSLWFCFLVLVSYFFFRPLCVTPPNRWRRKANEEKGSDSHSRLMCNETLA